MASKVVEVKLTEVEAVKELIADLTSRAERAEAAEARVRALHRPVPYSQPMMTIDRVEHLNYCAECGYGVPYGKCRTVAALDVVRPAEDGPAERRKIFREGLGKLPIQFWVCPVPGHSQHREDAPLRQTVEWRAGVAHCLEPGCGRSSADAPAALDGWQPATCCDIHGRNCEPPSELCCDRCTEAAHDTFPIRHADGSTCSAPDLSDNAPATGEETTADGNLDH